MEPQYECLFPFDSITQIKIKDGLLFNTGDTYTNNECQKTRQVSSSAIGVEKKTGAQLIKETTSIRKGGLPTSVMNVPWSNDEDRQLTRFVNQYGSWPWASIAKRMKGRVGKQCRERWCNHLKPDIKRDPWSEEEVCILIAAHKELGSKWSEISKRLPGRTENSIKNHWNATKRRQAAKRKTVPWKNQNSVLLLNYIKDLSAAERSSPSSSTNSNDSAVNNLESNQGSVNAEGLITGNGSLGETLFQNCTRSIPSKRSSPSSSFNSNDVGNINFYSNSGPNCDPYNGIKGNGSSREGFLENQTRSLPPTRLSRSSSFNSKNVSDAEFPINAIVYGQSSKKENVALVDFAGDGQNKRMLAPSSSTTSSNLPSSFNMKTIENAYLYHSPDFLGQTSGKRKVSRGGFPSDEETMELFLPNNIHSSPPRAESYPNPKCSAIHNSMNKVNTLSDNATFCVQSSKNNASFYGDREIRRTLVEEHIRSLPHQKWLSPSCSWNTNSIDSAFLDNTAATYKSPTGQRDDPFDDFTDFGNFWKVRAGDLDGINDLKTWFGDL
ncbi:unnamed protein product [Rhodiola kirilowii]